jgi:hypothetical protein
MLAGGFNALVLTWLGGGLGGGFGCLLDGLGGANLRGGDARISDHVLKGFEQAIDFGTYFLRSLTFVWAFGVIEFFPEEWHYLRRFTWMTR